MTRMRQRIAQRLKDSQNTYAMLTTFNEVDMRFVSVMVLVGSQALALAFPLMLLLAYCRLDYSKQQQISTDLAIFRVALLTF